MQIRQHGPSSLENEEELSPKTKERSRRENERPSQEDGGRDSSVIRHAPPPKKK
jgi:hypothetical protein